jgi:hypothetical protein
MRSARRTTALGVVCVLSALASGCSERPAPASVRGLWKDEDGHRSIDFVSSTSVSWRIHDTAFVGPYRLDQTVTPWRLDAPALPFGPNAGKMRYCIVERLQRTLRLSCAEADPASEGAAARPTAFDPLKTDVYVLSEISPEGSR